MCKRHFGYLECARCHSFYAGIDILERCTETREPIFAQKEHLSGLTFYPHEDKLFRKTAFASWHYDTSKSLGLVEKNLAYGDGTTVCANCTGTARDRSECDTLRQNLEKNWPRAIRQAEDRRIFEKTYLDQRLGIPRETGFTETCIRWYRCSVKRRWSRRAGW
ncbi:hypothetical protein GQ53DRAFT_826924 [Thozetella sp. PMI_491]|nr:hypothetical protein GQ53DRAFT_826924 [Thozetella sp. PMI_491]